jgi:hypothetical protein
MAWIQQRTELARHRRQHPSHRHTHQLPPRQCLARPRNAIMQALILGQAQAPVHNFAANDAALHEISAYKAQPLLAISTGELYNCPLLWWHDRRHLFPRLFQLMKRFLCIPATSASSERVFSLAGYQKCC